MQTSKLMAMFVAACAVMPVAHAKTPKVHLWHSDTVWAGQGMCAATFTVDGGFDDAIESLQIKISAIDAKGKTVAQDTLEFPGRVGGSTADRYGQALFESAEACDDTRRIVVQSAAGSIGGKQQNVMIDTREFKPFRITGSK